MYIFIHILIPNLKNWIANIEIFYQSRDELSNTGKGSDILIINYFIDILI